MALEQAQAFRQSLAVGQLGESLIAHWLRGKGWHVLPAYEKEIDNGKGPRLFMAHGPGASELITPDLLALRQGKFLWVEAKHKTSFTWYGRGACWTTGVDKRHFADYVQVQAQTGIDVWLLFLHRERRTRPADVLRWDAPPECPTGLFGNRITLLMQQMSHESDRWGPTGMRYWTLAQLVLLASLEEITQGLRDGRA